ncbi:glycosyltransferase [Corynebacterium mendelii]|uniref:CDP-glycerol glycerophosphotransferase family protein n=1 Tax=Corynebacterium mendelii TaxID=2765362 RepID=A0A939E0G9_9CORY|nr:glycosyltransferase [Corynebacterium mendelii]MBN9643593.1 CDP-glycerol glycerophosphotransferase family protein [Corynebacterium mendelii]
MKSKGKTTLKALRKKLNFDEKPLISIVTAAYNSSQYLEDYFYSLSIQTYGRANFEILFVDDGSDDDTVKVATELLKKYRLKGEVLVADHCGPGAARNRGLSRAKGDWITFIDSDDFVASDYFQRVMKVGSLMGDARPEIVASRLVSFYEDTGKLKADHPMDWHFSNGDCVVDLDQNPHCFHMSGGTIFVRGGLVRSSNIRFDERINPSFEDANFIARVLLNSSKPKIGFVRSAIYYYRRRKDSVISRTWATPQRYDEILRYGMLDLIDEALVNKGAIPGWIAGPILYDIGWCLRANDRLLSPTDWLTDEQRFKFCNLVGQIVRAIGPSTLWSLYLPSFDGRLRAALAATFLDELSEPEEIVPLGTVTGTKVRRFSYRFTGPLPTEKVYVNGQLYEPPYTGIRDHNFYKFIGFRERILYVDIPGRVNVKVNNSFLPPRDNKKSRFVHFLSKPKVKVLKTLDAKRDRLTSEVPGALPELLKQVAALTGNQNRRYVLKLAWYAGVPGRRRFKKKLFQASLKNDPPMSEKPGGQIDTLDNPVLDGCWLLYDSFLRADDNAEHLFRFLFRNHPEVRPYYVLSSESADWERLAMEGLPVIAYGSEQFHRAVRGARVIISSHADRDKLYPSDRISPKSYKAPFVFLQHGVSSHDMSKWFNQKNLGLLIAATNGEYRSFVDRNSPYKFTSFDTAFTGFPRFDRLLELSSRERAEKKLVVVMPTWRVALAEEMDECDTASERFNLFRNSEYGRSWISVLEDPALRSGLQEAGYKLVYLVHPSLAARINLRDYFDGIEVIDMAEVSIQDYLADAAALVTDESSIAFDAAYCGASIFYFHDENDRSLYSGQHTYRPGYFNYLENGFGPVLFTLDQLREDLLAGAKTRFVRTDKYEARVSCEFGSRDTRNCERTYNAILKRLEVLE